VCVRAVLHYWTASTVRVKLPVGHITPSPEA